MVKKRIAEGRMAQREHGRLGAEARWSRGADLLSRAEEEVIRTGLQLLAPKNPPYVRAKALETMASVLGMRESLARIGASEEARRTVIAAAKRARDRARDGGASAADITLLRRLKEGGRKQEPGELKAAAN
jgi:hypothetical protein